MKSIFKQLTVLTILITSMLLFIPKKAIADEPCNVPDTIGTISVGRDAASVGWTYDATVISAGSVFRVSYVEKDNPPFSDPDFVTTGDTSSPYEYNHVFNGLTENTTYIWKLTISCDDGFGGTATNNDIIKGFVTTPTLDVSGFLFVNGQMVIGRRINVVADFLYFRDPIFDLLTESVGSGRLHVIDIY